MDIGSLLSIVISAITSAIPFVQRVIERRKKARERQKLIQAGVIITFGLIIVWTLTRKR